MHRFLEGRPKRAFWGGIGRVCGWLRGLGRARKVVWISSFPEVMQGREEGWACPGLWSLYGGSRRRPRNRGCQLQRTRVEVKVWSWV